MIQAQKMMDTADRNVNRRPDRCCKLAGELASHLIHVHRLASDHYHFLREDAERLSDGEGVRWNRDVHIHPLHLLHRIDLEHVYGPGLAASGHRIGNDEKVTGREQLLREADSRGTNFEELDAFVGEAGDLEPADDFDAETVVAT